MVCIGGKMKEIKNKGEKKFAELLDKQKLQYIHQPKLPVLREISYTPDFYVLQTNKFYEVIATRQAFNQNRPKIEAAKIVINLEVVNPDGTSFYNRAVNKEISSTRIKLNWKYKAFDTPLFLSDYNITLEEFMDRAKIKCKNTVTTSLQKKRINTVHYNNLILYYGDLSKYTLKQNYERA